MRIICIDPLRLCVCISGVQVEVQHQIVKCDCQPSVNEGPKTKDVCR